MYVVKKGETDTTGFSRLSGIRQPTAEEVRLVSRYYSIRANRPHKFQTFGAVCGFFLGAVVCINAWTTDDIIVENILRARIALFCVGLFFIAMGAVCIWGSHGLGGSDKKVYEAAKRGDFTVCNAYLAQHVVPGLLPRDGNYAMTTDEFMRDAPAHTRLITVASPDGSVMAAESAGGKIIPLRYSVRAEGLFPDTPLLVVHFSDKVCHFGRGMKGYTQPFTPWMLSDEAYEKKAVV